MKQKLDKWQKLLAERIHEADEAAMILKVFQLNDLKAKDLMIPRVSAP